MSIINSNWALDVFIGKPIHVETPTKYYSGTLVNRDYCQQNFIELTNAQWVACTGRFSTYCENPEGDASAEFEPCPNVLIAISAIIAIIPLPSNVRKLK